MTSASNNPGAPPSHATVALVKRESGSTFVASADNDELKAHEFIKVVARAHVAHLRAKYHHRLDQFEVNTGNKHALDCRAGKHYGSEVLHPQEKEALWTGQFAVGTPPVLLQMDLDTGSSDTFAFPKFYDPAKSSTAKRTSKSFSLHYGDGTHARGDVYEDSVRIAGLTAQHQAFGVATENTLDTSDSQGMAGMAFESIASSKSLPFFQTMMKQGVLAQSVFCFGLWSKHARFDLGYAAREAYEGEFAWSKVDPSHGFWTTSFNVGGVDGTTMIVGPAEAIKKIAQESNCYIKEEDGTVYLIYEHDKPPQLTLTFNGTTFAISAENLAFQRHGNLVVSGIVGADMGLGQDAWVVGDTFLKGVYACFDVGGMRVGFAPKAGEGKAE
ncbi:hypothetical protein OC845_006373 [Tilletia horrida]|nr:hypothetical protein OC845_006373 [Tilletia horrida]